MAEEVDYFLRRGRRAKGDVPEMSALAPLFVEGFGCRLMATMRLAPGPASESLQ